MTHSLCKTNKAQALGWEYEGTESFASRNAFVSNLLDSKHGRSGQGAIHAASRAKGDCQIELWAGQAKLGHWDKEEHGCKNGEVMFRVGGTPSPGSGSVNAAIFWALPSHHARKVCGIR